MGITDEINDIFGDIGGAFGDIFKETTGIFKDLVNQFNPQNMIIIMAVVLGGALIVSSMFK